MRCMEENPRTAALVLCMCLLSFSSISRIAGCWRFSACVVFRPARCRFFGPTFSEGLVATVLFVRIDQRRM
ncbi:hypothetical protein B0J12DRAFT_650778 [Macrophomina phaseolina]|uniref:Secreted protein n=1 Tax=Macrophomina phaseolina TaxID=35725 RepID=A0ABQ8GJI2_9PEZI|nr:hypothetical protein B0J12DRAFT_650778 [Macrophomina phaseolina]